MYSLAFTKNEPLDRILALALASASEFNKAYPQCDAHQFLDFDVVMRPLNKNKY